MIHAKYKSPRAFGFEEEDFLSFLYISLYKNNDPRGGVNFDPRGIIWTILVKVYKMMIYAKKQSPGAFTFGEEDFLSFLNISLCKNNDPRGGVNFDPRDIIWTILVEVHKMMMHANYKSPVTFWFEKEDFLKFSLYKSLQKQWPPGWGQFLLKGHNLNNLGRGS